MLSTGASKPLGLRPCSQASRSDSRASGSKRTKISLRTIVSLRSSLLLYGVMLLQIKTSSHSLRLQRPADFKQQVNERLLGHGETLVAEVFHRDIAILLAETELLRGDRPFTDLAVRP